MLTNEDVYKNKNKIYDDIMDICRPIVRLPVEENNIVIEQMKLKINDYFKNKIMQNEVKNYKFVLNESDKLSGKIYFQFHFPFNTFYSIHWKLSNKTFECVEPLLVELESN